MPKGDKLPIKQALFVKYYLIDRNATQAYIKAWYSAKTANEGSSRLLANVKIKALVDEGLKELNSQLDFDWLRVLKNMKRVAEVSLVEVQVVDKKWKPKVDKDWKPVYVLVDAGAGNTALSNLSKYLIKDQSLDITSKGEKIGLSEKQLAAIKSLTKNK
jgi:hypothetical protein